MVCALMVAFMPVAPVSAATAVEDVWVEFPVDDAAGSASDLNYNVADAVGLYRIHFKTTNALTRGVDTITVQFPDGIDTDMGPATSTYAFTLGAECSTANNFDIDPDAAGTDYGYYNCASASYGGKRVTVTVGWDVAAGSEVWLMIDEAASMVTGGGDHETTPYKVKVHTSQDTTPVLSTGFYLGDDDDVVGTTTVAVSPDTAGSTSQYIITFTPTETHDANTDTVTVIFPYGTTVPSSIPASSVEVYGTPNSYSTCGQAPTVDTDLRRVIVTLPCALDTSESMIKFTTTAGIENPTTAATDWGYTDTGDRCGFIRTSNEPQNYPMDIDSGYTVTYSAPTKLNFNDDDAPSGEYSDKYTMINMYSSVLYLHVEDEYGNYVSAGAYALADVTLSSTSGSGNFYTGTTTLITGTQALTAGKKSIRYKDTAAGTHTLTASCSGLDDATWTVQVCPGVSLYDSSNNLINTYASTASDPQEEASNVVAGDYITNAISAAITGDTIKLGDGTYELDTALTLDEKVTLTSVHGASSTTLVPTDDNLDAITIGVSGTSTNPVIIDGITFTWLRGGVGITTVAFDEGVLNNGYNYLTVRNCVFNYIQPTNHIDDWNGAAVIIGQNDSGVAAITSGTISNNTFNYCGGVTNWSSGAKSAAIAVFAKHGSLGVSGVTVSGNTLNNCDGYGIMLKGISTGTVVADVTNNTLTNCFSPIQLTDYVGSSATSVCSVTGNTVSRGYANAIKLTGAYAYGVTIKNNTVSDTAAIYSSNCAIRIDRKALGTPTDCHYVQYNSITNTDGGTGYGIYIGSTDAADITVSTIDCRYNWFGDASGPAYTAVTGATVGKSNPNGTGDQITDRVFYYPWLHKPLTDVVTDNVSWQTSVMKLVAGWNTLSTPVPLIAEADTVQELIPSGMSIGYYYDGGWTQITTAYTLSPCDAVYVKMDEAKYVQLKFETKTFSTPSKDLAVGWNLCSLAYLNSAGLEADDAVASVYKTAGNLPGYGQVVGPSLNTTRYDIHYNVGTSWAVSCGQHGTSLGTSYHMYPGMGYWIYMQNACTLAGFEIMPIAPDLD
jgi:hypothetical protein